MTQTSETFDTMTPAGFKSARLHLGLSRTEMARVMAVNERTLVRWEDDPERGVHPTAALMMNWFLDGFRPPSWPFDMTGPDLRRLREEKGLSISEMAERLDVPDQTLTLWESDDRGPPPVVAQAVRWIVTDQVSTEL